jgi:hypothetical protein
LEHIPHPLPQPRAGTSLPDIILHLEVSALPAPYPLTSAAHSPTSGPPSPSSSPARPTTTPRSRSGSSASSASPACSSAHYMPTS